MALTGKEDVLIKAIEPVGQYLQLHAGRQRNCPRLTVDHQCLCVPGQVTGCGHAAAHKPSQQEHCHAHVPSVVRFCRPEQGLTPAAGSRSQCIIRTRTLQGGEAMKVKTKVKAAREGS